MSHVYAHVSLIYDSPQSNWDKYVILDKHYFVTYDGKIFDRICIIAETNSNTSLLSIINKNHLHFEVKPN